VARGEEVMETVNSGWKTGPVSAMEGVESEGVTGVPGKLKKGEHLVSKQKKRRRAKGTAKALAVCDRISGRKSSKQSRNSIRQSAKQLW